MKFKKKFQEFKKIRVDSEKLINSLEAKKRIGIFVIYGTIFFGNLLVTFRNYYCAK